MLLLTLFFFILIFIEWRRRSSLHIKKIASFLEEAVAIIDSSKKVYYCNKKFFKILRMKEVETPFKGELLSSSSPHLMSEIIQITEKAFASLEEVQETFFLKKEEEELAISIKAIKLSRNKLALILHDKDQEKREFTLGKEFIANASHELRTPITIIKGFVETLQDLPEVSDAMLADIFEKILRNCSRMEEIVKNLLILTDLDHLFKLRKEKVDLLLVADNLKHHLLQLYPKALIEIRAEEKEMIAFVDRPLVELALINLMQNAAKYSKEKISITLEILKKEQEMIVSVIDEGIGIPKEKLPFIFDRFYSVDKTLCRKLGGAGLGLSIVKKILDKHQGLISVEENQPAGTIFRLHFPLDCDQGSLITM